MMLKVLLAAELVLGFGAAAAAAAFVGAVTWSGCFIECDASGGDEQAGALLYLLALALLVAGPVLARFMWRSGDSLSTWAVGLLGLPGLLLLLSALGGVRGW